jgi:hypothetical protein
MMSGWWIAEPFLHGTSSAIFVKGFAVTWVYRLKPKRRTSPEFSQGKSGPSLIYADEPAAQ